MLRWKNVVHTEILLLAKMTSSLFNCKQKLFVEKFVRCFGEDVSVFVCTLQQSRFCVHPRRTQGVVRDSTGFDTLPTERTEARAEFRVINASLIGGCVHFAVLSRDCVKGQNVKYSNPEARLREWRAFTKHDDRSTAIGHVPSSSRTKERPVIKQHSPDVLNSSGKKFFFTKNVEKDHSRRNY